MAYLQEDASGPPAPPAEDDRVTAFLNGLPSGEFTREEEMIRGAIVDLLMSKGPRSVEQVMGDPTVGKKITTFLLNPRLACFIAWVEERIGGEVELISDEASRPQRWTMRLMDNAAGGARPPPPPPVPHYPSRDWFASLPQDDFLFLETQLRNAIFDFLAMWRSPQRAFVRDLEFDPALRSMCAELFPPGIFLAQWIDYRIGAEVEVAPDGSIGLTGVGQQIVQERTMEIERGRNMGYPYQFQPPLPPPVEDVYTSDVPPLLKGVRKALEKARRRDPEAFAQPMTISDLKRLIERDGGKKFEIGTIARVGNDFGLRGPAEVLRKFCSDLVNLGRSNRGSGDPDGVKAEKNKKKQERREANRAAREQPETQNVGIEAGGEAGIDPVPVEEPEGAPEGADPFAKLPEGKLWAKERRLKLLLIKWILNRHADGDLDNLLVEEALREFDIERTFESFLGRQGVPFQEWIERRLKDEIGVGIDEHDRPLIFPLVSLEELEAQCGQADQRAAPQRAAPQEHSSDTRFFDNLPTDSLSSCEFALAEKLMDNDGVPLSKAQMDASHEKQNLLEEVYGEGTNCKKLPFKKWIETRLGDYMVLEMDGNQPIIKVVAPKRKRPVFGAALSSEPSEKRTKVSR